MTNACKILVSKSQEESISITSEQTGSYANRLNLASVYLDSSPLEDSYKHGNTPAGFINVGYILTS